MNTVTKRDDGDRQIETERTILVAPQEKDYDDLLALHLHEEVSKYLGGPIIREQFESHFQKMLIAAPPDSYWVVRHKESDAFMGLISIDLHHDKQHYELSYQFLPEFWGQGYATEVLSSVVEYAFTQLGLHELISETQEKNEKSIRLLERLGMTYMKTLERFGEQQVIYEIQKDS